jgi:hypothetical protein
MAGDPYTLDGDSIAKLRSDHERLASQFRNTQIVMSQVLNAAPGSPAAKRLRFRNDSGQPIPAYACLQVTGTYTFQGIPGITVTQCNSALATRYVLNGPNPVAPGGTDWAEFTGDVRGINAGAAPAAGDRLGPTVGSWSLTAGNYPPIFTADGGAAGNLITGNLATIQNFIFGASCLIDTDTGAIVANNVTLSTGETVTAINLGDTVRAGDECAVFLDLPSLLWCLIGGGGNNMAIVNVYGTTANGSCLWPGKVAAPQNGSGYCTDNQFTDNTACLLVVLNSDLGSAATTKVLLNVGEHYIGRRVGAIAGVPVYAIRVEDNFLYRVTIPSPGVGPGLTISITLPTGQTVTATNWSAATLNTSDKAFVAKDLSDGNWYLWKSGGAGAKTWHVTLAGNVASGANINVTLPDTTVVSATNWSGVNLFNGEPATVYQDPVSGTYYLVRSGPPIFHVTLAADVAAGATVTVTLPTTGSPTITATNWSGIKLSNGEKVTVYQDLSNQTWYLVRTGHNIFHITLGTNIAAGGTGTVTLPTTGSPTVTATNWSGSAMNSGDKVTVYQDSSDGIWYLIKTGGAEAVVRFRLTAPLDYDESPGTANAVIVNFVGGVWVDGATITVYDPTAVGDGTATWSGFGDFTDINGAPRLGCRGEAILKADSGVYEIISMQSRAKRIEGFAYASFTKTTPVFFIILKLWWDGRQPEDMLTPGSSGVLNLIDVANADSGQGVVDEELPPYVFECEEFSTVRAEYDEVENQYRIVWGECPQNSPVQGGSPGDGGSIWDSGNQDIASNDSGGSDGSDVAASGDGSVGMGI